MSYAIPTDADAAEGIRHVIEDQLGKAIDAIEGDGYIHDRLHDVRKRFKKIRAALRLAREPLGDHYKPNNVLYRDAGRRLSEMRDAEALIEILDSLEDAFSEVLAADAFNNLREQVVTRRDAMAEAMGVQSSLEEMRDVIERGREMMGDWGWSGGDFDDLRPGLIKSFSRAQKEMKRSYKKGKVKHFHEWRKRVKYHRYHLRILRKMWPEVINPQRHRLHDLTDLLGDDHDLHIFLDTIDSDDDIALDPEVRKAVGGLIKAQSKAYRKKAKPIGKLFFKEKEKRMADRLELYWKYAARR